MSSYEINSSSHPITISSPNKELPSQQTNPFVRDLGHSFPPPTSHSSPKPLRDLPQEYRSGTSQPSNSKPCIPIGDWWEAVEDAEDDNVSSDNLVVGSSTAASTDSITHISSWERHLNNVSELTLDGSDPEGGLHSDYSGPEYSDDNDMYSNSSFSDDEDDDFFNVAPLPSSWADLFEICLNGPQPPKKRYRSGWWEEIGSQRSLFPASYTVFESSDRLPPLLEEEEPRDDITTSLGSR
jgi:hypothetical protein